MAKNQKSSKIKETNKVEISLADKDTYHIATNKEDVRKYIEDMGYKVYGEMLRPLPSDFSKLVMSGNYELLFIYKLNKDDTNKIGDEFKIEVEKPKRRRRKKEKV